MATAEWAEEAQSVNEIAFSGRQRTMPVPVRAPNLEPTDMFTPKIRALWNRKVVKVRFFFFVLLFFK